MSATPEKEEDQNPMELITHPDYRYIEPDAIGIALIEESNGDHAVVINGFDQELRPHMFEGKIVTSPFQVAKITMAFRIPEVIHLFQSLGEILSNLPNDGPESQKDKTQEGN